MGNERGVINLYHAIIWKTMQESKWHFPPEMRLLKVPKTILLVIRALVVVVVLIVFIAIFYQFLFWHQIFPGVTIVGIYVGGKSATEAVQALSVVDIPDKFTLTVPSPVAIPEGKSDITIVTSDFGLMYNLQTSAQTALLVGRQGTLKDRVFTQLFGLTHNIPLTLAFSVDQEKLSKFVDETSELLEITPIEPTITLENGSVRVDSGKDGQLVEKEILYQRIYKAIGETRSRVEIPIKTVSAAFTSDETKEVISRGERLIRTTVFISFEGEAFEIKDTEIVNLLAPLGIYNNEKIQGVVDTITTRFERPVQEPTFRFENGRVEEFKPSKSGVVVEKSKLIEHIIVALIRLESGEKKVSLNLPVVYTNSKITTAEVNNLGIKELIGRGVSRFRGSILSRVHNISLASFRLDGILIPPGETLSFNKVLGDVSAFTGYQQAYVIRDGKTVLGDGGGVCQVSTTLFRAALKAGLPIVERRAHSYRVAYYEQDSGPGFDATVYDPTTDLKIKNDTTAHILVQTIVDKKTTTLTFELYGTSDGRIATTSKPRTWDVVEPPPDLYQDDPTLPIGIVKQIDFKAWGSKSAFDYKVIRGSETLQEKTFYSTYRPWQAIYLRG
ncbi:VanW family protein, partial [Candidatus Microgenomates bacterium]|nr:VanW family protein [Candidatus Microgenomates bacterium]